MILLWATSLALAAETHVVRQGETVESISFERVVDAQAVRDLNGLAPGDQPVVGTILQLGGPVTDPARSVAHVLEVSGEGTATPPGEESVPIRPWLELVAGTVVCTSEAGYASVRLASESACTDHDDVSLLPGTCLTVRSTWVGDGRRSSHVVVTQGSVAVPEGRAEAGEVAVETPSGVTVADRGGFRVTIEEDAARTEALTQPVSVIGAGTEVPLVAGQGSRVRTGEAPSAPIELLEPGTPLRPGAGRQLVRPDFEWTPVEHALGYRVELSSTPDFTALVRREEVPQPEWRPALLFLPFRRPGLWWRVSAFDRGGFLGLPSEPVALSFPAGVGP